MPSNINTSSIDETYPVAGQDNNSQGFRDNFTNIKIGLHKCCQIKFHIELYICMLKTHVKHGNITH